MRNFYIILLAASGIYLIVQLLAYMMYKKVFFAGSGELFSSSKNKFQWQTVFPKNLPLFVVFLFVSSAFGILLDFLGVVSWLSLPSGAAGGLAVNFIINMYAVPQYLKAREKGAPTDAELDGVTALVTQDIYPKDYGKIRVEHGGRSYIFDAILANDTRILAGTEVVVIYAQEGLCFVESVQSFCDVLFEDDEPLKNTGGQDFADFTEGADGNDTEH